MKGEQESYKKQVIGPKETAQWLRILSAHAKDPGSVPNTDIMAHNHL